MIDKWIKRLIYIIAFFAITIVLLSNILYINNINNAEISNIERYKITYLLMSIVIAFILILVSYVIQKIKVHSFIKMIIIFVLLIGYAVAQIVWIHESVALPFADSEQILIIAKGLIGKGELVPYCLMYLQYYPQQLTLAAVLAFIFEISNTTNHMILQYINVICNVFAILGLYAIVRNLSEKYKINQVLFFIISLTFIPMILLATFIYGDFIGLAFVIWAVYFAMQYTKKQQKRYVVLTGIFVLIACLVRMNYFIFAIAIVLYWLVDLLEETKKDRKTVLTSIGLILVFLVISMVPNSILKKSYQQKYNLNSQKAFSTIPYLYMGISEGERGEGWYNSEMGDMVYHLMCDEPEETEKIREKCMSELRDRVKFLAFNPIDTIKFYGKKITSMWSEPTMEFGFYHSIYPEGTNLEEHKLAKEVLEGKTYKVIQIYQKGLTILILTGVIATIIYNRKKLDKDAMLLCLVFLGGFTFHLLWEAKSRYILPYVIILIPVACIGITETIDKLEKKIKEKINIKRNEGIET